MSTETITRVEPKTASVNEYLDALANKTILITGAGGYLGTALLSSLYGIRCRIVGLVHQRKCISPPAESDAELTSRHVDLSKPSVWREIIREIRPDIVFNLASFEHKRDSAHSPALDLAVNSATVLELLEACRELGLKPRIVLASSANIVGCARSRFVDEATPDNPLTLYAIHKLAAEQYLRYYADTFNLLAVSLRFANIYGPLKSGDTELESRVVLNRIMRRALAGGPLYLYRNQNCVRDFVYVDDAVRALCAAAVTKTILPGGKYIVGSGEGQSLTEVVNTIAAQVEQLGQPRVDVLFEADAKLEPIEWREFIARYTRLRSATGWEPCIDLHQGIDLTLRAFIGGQAR